MSFASSLAAVQDQIEDQSLLLFLQSLAAAVDRLNVNFSLSYDQPTALQNQSVSADVDVAASLGPDILVVNAIRFLGDRHGLTLESAESMGALVIRQSNQTIVTSTLTIINFPDTDQFDLDDMHDVTVNNSRLTINHAGRYLVGAAIRWSVASSVGYRRTILLLNGTTNLDFAVDPGAVVGNGPSQRCFTLFQFAQGDYIEVQVYQTSGGNLDVIVGTDSKPTLWAHRIS